MVQNQEHVMPVQFAMVMENAVRTITINTTKLLSMNNTRKCVAVVFFTPKLYILILVTFIKQNDDNNCQVNTNGETRIESPEECKKVASLLELPFKATEIHTLYAIGCYTYAEKFGGNKQPRNRIIWSIHGTYPQKDTNRVEGIRSICKTSE
jgi:hypothetical protein